MTKAGQSAIALGLAALVAACASGLDEGEAGGPNDPGEDALQTRLRAREALSRPPPEPVPVSESEPVTGEAPAELLERIVADLAQRLDVEKGAVSVVIAQSVTWSDGSLGCPQPDMLYTQALVPGYRVVLVTAGRQYDYRASSRGYFFLCESPQVAPRRPGESPDG
jgi:hypothetical protein